MSVPSPHELPLTAYGAIGNLRTVALIGCDGAVAWWCLPLLDSPSLFASLLDTQRGGCFRVAPAGGPLGEQHYVDRTNVLETRYAVGAAALVVTDFMPVSGRGSRLRPQADELHRIVAAETGDIDVEVEWSPRFDYARGRTGIGAHGSGWLAIGTTDCAVLGGLPEDAQIVVDDRDGRPTLRARFALRAGSAAALVMRHACTDPTANLDEARRLLRATIAAWRRWTAHGHDTGWAGPHAALVQRTALAMKLLCNADTGAIAAAATTSLPEAIGGERNWDYRYAWLRDAGMTIEALLGAGHPEEALAFLRFIERAERRANRRGPWLQLVFGLHGESELPLTTLDHLAGYRGSRPVRIGNAIAEHRGHDIYEQVLGAALEYVALGHPLPAALRRFLARVADIVADDWRHPDHGIWELPDGPRHYVHSKWTASTALDHAMRLARDHGVAGDVERWRRERDAIRRQVLEHGWDERRGCFRMAYDIDAVDAANVLMPVLGFLPADDPRVAANLERTMEELVVDDLCYRYRVDDGLRGEEGCFVACTFWIVEALLLAGQVERARALFDRAAARAGPLGLWPEQIDVGTGAHLGNLPQAFSHAAFHDAALRLAAAEGRAVPVSPDPAGIGAGSHRPVRTRHRGMDVTTAHQSRKRSMRRE